MKELAKAHRKILCRQKYTHVCGHTAIWKYIPVNAKETLSGRIITHQRITLLSAQKMALYA